MKMPDPEWLFEPNPVLARALEAENRPPRGATGWDGCDDLDDVWGDTEDDRYQRCRALNAEMEGHGRPRRGVA